MGFDTCIMTRTHHGSILQNSLFFFFTSKALSKSTFSQRLFIHAALHPFLASYLYCKHFSMLLKILPSQGF